MMKALALIIGLILVVLGIIGLIVPGTLVRISEPFATPSGIWAATAIRIGFGVILLLAAPVSRAPVALKIIGWFLIVAGFLTSFVAPRSAQRMIDTWIRDPLLVRGWAIVAILLGSFIIWALRIERRPTVGF